MFKYLILPFIATSALAQDRSFDARMPCNTVQFVAEQSVKYKEETLFNGKMLQQHASGQMVPSEFAFTVNQDTGTWTIISLFPNGIACMVANGTDFEPYVD